MLTTDPLTGAVRSRAPLSGVDVIDAHVHVGPFSRFFTPDPFATAMVRVMDRCGVRRAVLSSCLAIELDTAAGNAATAAVVETHSDRLAGYLTLNPHRIQRRRWPAGPTTPDSSGSNCTRACTSTR